MMRLMPQDLPVRRPARVPGFAGGVATMPQEQPPVMNEDQIALHRNMAAALGREATSAAPVGHWTQALARPVQGLVAGMHTQALANRGPTEDETATRELRQLQMAKALRDLEPRQPEPMTPYQRARLALDQRRLALDESNLRTPRREIRQAADGKERYVDTGEEVFPGVERELTPSDKLRFDAAVRAGFDPEQAAQIVAGLIIQRRDPLTGRTMMLDVQGNPVTPRGGAAPNQSSIPQGMGEPEGVLRPVSDDTYGAVPGLPQGNGGTVPVLPQNNIGDVPGLPPVPQAEPLPQGLPQQSQQPAAAEPQDQTGLFWQAEKINGIVQQAGYLATGVTEQLGPAAFRLLPVESQRAIADFQATENALVRAFTLNQKFPVTEVGRVLKLLESGILRSPGQLQIKMMALADELDSAMAADAQTINNPALPVEQRQEAIARYTAGQRFLQKLQVPPLISTREQAEQLPTGTIYRLPTGELRRRR